MENKNSLPQKQKLEELYASYNSVFTDVLNRIQDKLKTVVKLNPMPTYKARIKSFKSYYKKILRQKSEEAEKSNKLVTLTDMIGIRIICAFLEDLHVVEEQLLASFDVVEVERKGAQQSFREFGYESVHILIKIPEDCLTETTRAILPENLVCEIQVRTILQDAWAEVEHELIYKSEFNPFDKPLRRKLASINASLTLADMVFQEIRDYQNNLQHELGTRRNTFYDQADKITDEEFGIGMGNKNNVESLQQIEDAAIMEIEANHYSIDDLVLKALQAHNNKNFKLATFIYTKIITAKPEPNPVVLGVIYKHRGMANFAQNLYDEALSDFASSEKYDPNGFRAIYYEGIVYSLQEKHQEAIECFNRSLAIDKFQSHVYYRRALSYYNLGNYKDALEDINGAINLGLQDEDVMNLKDRIMKKFDINF